MTSVKVAVRCRPFNGREKDMNSKLIIRMDRGGNTYITNPVSYNSTSLLPLLIISRQLKKNKSSVSITVTGVMMAMLSQQKQWDTSTRSLVQTMTIRTKSSVTW